MNIYELLQNVHQKMGANTKWSYFKRIESTEKRRTLRSQVIVLQTESVVRLAQVGVSTVREKWRPPRLVFGAAAADGPST